jgi:hypothetical protein
MVAPLVALGPIVTAVGRFAVPYLAKELGKIGTNKFIQTYGNEAFTSLNETLTKNTTMVNPEAMPMVNPNFMSKKDDEETSSLPSIENKQDIPQQEPPEDKEPGLGTEVAAEAALQISKNLSKQEDIKSQTEKALEPKVEFGTLTETEKQTARALMGDQPKFYSRVVKSIKDAKQNKLTKNKWKSFIQGDKEELKFLGLDKFLQGNESITKQELLDFVEKKDITSGITVRSIPEDDMNSMYENYTIGSPKEGTQENIVFQFGRKNLLVDAVTSRPYDAEITPLFRSGHFDIEYGTNTFAHARTQVGYGDPDKIKKEMDMAKRVAESNKDKSQYADFSDEKYLKDLKLAKTFNNTLIVDEIQSDWLQKGRKKGFVSDYDIIPGDKLVDYFKKHNISYKISDPPLTVEFKQTGGEEIKSGDAPAMGVMNPNITYFFRKSDNTQAFKWDPESYEEDAKYSTPKEFLQRAYGIVPDFPIKESKKWVELVLNEMIKKATVDGRDSIAITNGEIQYNRYPAMQEKEKQGLKKFYDTIVYDQLKKIANKYGASLERVDITSNIATKEEEDNYFDQSLQRALDYQFTLQEITLQELWDRTKDTDIPGHATLYSNAGRGQGADYIENYITQLVENREPGSAATGLSLWDQIKNNKVYVWKAPTSNVDEEGAISWELPIVAKEDAVNYSPELQGDSLELYKKYIKDTKPPPDEKLQEEQLIKMKLPKKLQKDILSKPIKLSKAKQQTDRLFA